MVAYMFLAYTETEMNVLEMRESRTIEIFIECLDNATHDAYKRSRGYSVLELAKGKCFLVLQTYVERVCC